MEDARWGAKKRRNRFMKVFELNGSIDFIGDSHGDMRAIIRWLDGNTDNLIHLGDFGYYGKIHDAFMFRLGEELNKEGKWMYIVRGNHEYPYFDNNFFGGESGGVTLVKDNSILHWNDTDENILVNGGGISLNREDCKVGVDYWPDEIFKAEPLKDNSIKINHLLTHVSIGEVTGISIEHPFVLAFAANDADLIHDLYQEQADVRNYVDNLIEGGHNIKTWHYGHYHRVIQSEYRNIKCRGLAINEILPFGRRAFE